MTGSQTAAGTEALTQAAQDALMRRDPKAALELLAQAQAAGAASPALFLDLALARRMLNDLPGALEAVQGALTLEPYDLMALMTKAALLERMGRRHQAASAYKNALAVAPADEAIPAMLKEPARRGRKVVEEHAARMRAFLRGRVSGQRQALSGEALARFDEGLDILSGEKRAYVQQPLLLTYPRLPAIPFYDRERFDWLTELEAATPVIQEELAGALDTAVGEFVPYIAYPPGAPVNQWGELNHSLRWATYFLWRDGVRQDGACARCPRTAALLDRLPMAHQIGYAPTAMFSALQGRAHIPPHTGSANTRLIVHLPLVLPGPARFRVGNDVRDWKMGQAWVFDDTIEHEAWNEAEETRVILIFDVWNPLLSEAERQAVCEMMAALQDFERSADGVA
jgi:aspartate beta-hydroxylase